MGLLIEMPLFFYQQEGLSESRQSLLRLSLNYFYLYFVLGKNQLHILGH